ncbi:MAG: hypothetical protein WBW41_12160 [Verrucomicrobiia bacterium]
MNKLNPLENKPVGLRPITPKPKHRGHEMVSETVGEYDRLRGQLKEGESINLVCLIGNRSFDVFMVGTHDDFLEIRAKDKAGDWHVIMTPVEQISFDIIISKKISDEPPREIRFKPIEEARKKASPKF